MSIRCRLCNYEMTTCEFMGRISAELFLSLKERLKTRGISDGWNQFMAGFSDTLQMQCPVCKKFEGWAPAPEHELHVVQTSSKTATKEQHHVE